MITISTTTNPVMNGVSNDVSNTLDIATLHGNNFRNTNMSGVHLIQYSATLTGTAGQVAIQGSFDGTNWVTLKTIATTSVTAQAGTVSLYPLMRLLVSTQSGNAADNAKTAKLNIAY